MLPDGTTFRWTYLERGPYADVVVFATVEDGRIQFQGEPRSPSGATRDFDQLIRGEKGYPWEEWEWHTGTEWVPISRLKGE